MSWIQRIFRKPDIDDELDRELQFHIEELKQDFLAQGKTEADAHRLAMIEFGGKQQCKEDLRDVYRVRLLDATARNLRFAFRLLRKSPASSAVIILTLALGIGANSAVFSAIDAILLRPLPYPHSDELMLLQQQSPENPQPLTAPVRLEDWNRMNSSFQAIAGYYTEDMSETSGPLPEKLTQALVTPRFLQVFGVSPMLGRDFVPPEEKFGGPSATLISHRLWRERFNRDPGVIGRKLHFGKNSSTIVGVMPASFRFPDSNVDLWSAVPSDAPYAQDRRATWYIPIGRLKPGVSVAQARADLSVVQSRLAHQFPETDSKISVAIQPLKDSAISGSRQSLWLLFGAVTLLLLIACTNIAALLLARTTERATEIAVRFSLGASRGTVIAQLFTEVFVLAAIGSIAGLALAAAASKAFRVLAHSLPRVDEITLDWRITAYSLACAVLVTFLCGTIPALQAVRSGLTLSLAKKSRTQVSARHPFQWALVGTQVALAVTLLLGAGLLLRSFRELSNVNPGFESSHVLVLHVSGNWGETTDMKALTNRIDRILDRLRSVPGVEDAATSAMLPGIASKFSVEIKVLDGEVDPSRKLVADARFVSPTYFSTMRIPFLAGEACRNGSDAHDLIVNRSFVNHVFGRRNAIGHHLEPQMQFASHWSGEIRGVVADVREQGLDSNPAPTMYWCGSAPTPNPNYFVRTHGEPAAMANTLRLALREIEPSRAVFDIVPLDEHLSEAFSENRMRTLLLTIFAALAVSLACVGLYGTMSYMVNLRRREVGLRLALGARRQQVTTPFMLQAFRICLVGCVCGLALAAASTRLLEGMLFGISRNDPVTISAVVTLIIVVSGLAALEPVMRAARVDPMEVLREG
jgi:putative ABC transport system permease protein